MCSLESEDTQDAEDKPAGRIMRYVSSSRPTVRFIADLALVRTRSDAQIRAEVLAPRHQLRVFERRVGKPAW